MAVPVSAGKAGLSSTTQLNAPNPIYNEQFGWAVATDGIHLVVGAPNADVTVGETTYQYEGLAYIYDALDLSITPVTLTNPIHEAWASFGWSVAISGGYVVVGAISQTVSGITAGEVYLFDTNGNLLASIPDPDPNSYDNFGMSVAISGNYIVIGEPNANIASTSYVGQAFVYSIGATNEITLLAELNSPSGISYGQFGYSVAFNNGIIIVSEPGANNVIGSDTFVEAGNVYLYRAASLTLADSQPFMTFTSPNAQEGGSFGWSIGTYGKSIIIGAPGEDVSVKGVTDPYHSAGRAYVFTLTGRLAKTLVSPNVASVAGFGSAVAIGSKYMVVSAPYETVGSTQYVGQAYAYTTSGRLVSSLNSTSPKDNLQFGWNHVATGGNFIVVGSPYEDVNVEGSIQFQAGSAWVYR